MPSTSRPRHPKIVAVKLALDLDEQTRVILDSQSKIANYEWNLLIELCNEARGRLDAAAAEGIVGAEDDLYLLYGRHRLRDAMVAIKDQKPFLRSLYSSVSKNVALRLSRAIRDTRSMATSGRKKRLAWPHFNRWQSDWFSLEYDELGKGYAFVPGAIELSLGTNEAGERLRLRLPLRERRPGFLKPSTVRALRIVKDHGVYYAIATVTRQIVDMKPLPAAPKVISLDPGHVSPVVGYGTDGAVTDVARPSYLKLLDEAIDRVKAKRDRCQRRSILMTTPVSGKTYWQPSRRWTFYNDILVKLQRQRQEQITAWCNALANLLLREYDVVSMGDYAPHGGGRTKGERRSMNNRSLIGHLRSTLGWMAERSGKRFMAWPERHTTMTCANCGTRLPESLKPDIRVWTCPSCNTLNHRDANAAMNGLRLTLEALQSSLDSPEIDLLPCSGHQEAVSRGISSWRTVRLTEVGITQVISPLESVTGLLA